MATTFDYTVELFANNIWNDITDDVYGHDRADVHISMSRSSESGAWQPSWCTMQLNNRLGKYSPRNAAGPYSGSLGVNTQLRIYRDLIWSGFGTAVSSSWSPTDTGETWSTISVGGTISATDYNVTGGKGTHSVPAANASRTTYMPGALFGDCDMQADLTLDRTDITGAGVSWGFVFWGRATNNYFRVSFEVQTDESIRIFLFDDGGTDLTGGGHLVPGITHSVSQVLRARVNIDRECVRAKLWVPATQGEPYGWEFDTQLEAFDTSPGFIGLQSFVNTGNTNTKPIVFSYDNWYVRSDRFFGEVSDWPNAWDTTGRDVYVNLTASSLMRRAGVANAPIKSPVRQAIELNQNLLEGAYGSTNQVLITYVPIEEGPQAVNAAPQVGPYQVVLTGNVRALSQHWGKGDLNGWLYPGVALYGDGQLACAINQTIFIPADGWRVDWVIKNSASVNWTIHVQTGTFTWDMLMNPTTKQVTVTRPGGSTVLDIPQFFDSAPHSVRLDAHQSGADIIWGFSIDGIDLVLTIITGQTLQGLSHWRIDSSALHDGPIAVAHAAAWGLAFGGSTDVETGVAGFNEERSIYRMQRLGGDAGINLIATGSRVLTAQVGPQSLAPAGQQIDEAEKVDMGLLRDLRSVIGMGYRPLNTLINQAARVTLDYAAKQLVLPLSIVDDDQYIKNDVTASNANGGRYRFSVEEGPMSAKSPADGGVQRYTDQQTYNVAFDAQLQDIAGWQASLGTVDEPRLSEICVNISRSQIGRQLLFDIMQSDVGDVVQINNIPYNKGFGATTARELIIGYEEIVNHFVQEIRYVPKPEAPYQVIRWDDSDVSRMQAGSSFLYSSITNSATTLIAQSLDNTRWTNKAASLPIPIRIGGEDMSVTAVTNTVPAFIGAGTAAHADNANVTPTLHGSSANGHLVIIMAAIRNTAAAPSTPAGYTLLVNAGNVRFFGKIIGAGEPNPTVSFLGGAAGDTTSAQCVTFSNVGLTVHSQFAGINGSAQNIGYGELDTPMCDGIGIIWAWKQDDWTGVSTVDSFGWTEIGEPSSTLGNDQGIVWDYKIFDGDVIAPDGTLTVTGGASAISKAGAFVLGNWQTLTVSRGQNGTPAVAHTADGSERCRIRARGRTRVALERAFTF